MSVPLIAPPAVKTVLRNVAGIPIHFCKPGAQSIEVPELTGWVFRDSPYEVQTGLDDSKWGVANKTSTNIYRARALRYVYRVYSPGISC